MIHITSTFTFYFLDAFSYNVLHIFKQINICLSISIGLQWQYKGEKLLCS